METIWTTVRRPFTMGGDVNHAISTQIEPLEYREIWGFKFFSFETPQGSLRIAEAISGGIVADSFEQIEKSIEDCTSLELKGQIQSANQRYPYKEDMTNEEFFKVYKF